MDQNSLDLLEYASLKALLGREVSTVLGARRLAELQPGTDQAKLERSFSEVAEAMKWAEEQASPSAATRGSVIRFSGLPDVEASAGRLRVEGAGLDGKEIHDLMAWLERSTEIRQLLLQNPARYPGLSAIGQQLGDFRGVLRQLQGKILPDGSLADDASMALSRIRRGIEKQRQNISDSLQSFLRKHRDEGVLQDEYVTLRNDRFVVPLLAGAKKRVEGVVHASSGTGATLFIEPMETIQLNNELVRLTEEEFREVHRILRELTEALRAQKDDVQASLPALAHLEILFAKAHFARRHDCVIPEFGEVLHLDQARHPLLEDVLRREGNRPVPISFTLDPIQRTLLITGPNTGGKTVTMKTAGLLALMAQSGIPIPARRAQFPIFTQVLADMGDNQSIAESLSSFSSHVRHLGTMLASADTASLVLLDELGRATDPEEGGALGIAILEAFREYGAFTLASTHLMALKVWGANTVGVVQASMGFDEDTLTPTYLLQTGAPGRSAGLAIASRLGLPASILTRAREKLGTTEREIGDFLRELHRRLKEVQEQQEELDAARKSLAAETEREREALRKQFAAQKEETERKTEATLQRFEKQAQELLGSLSANANLSGKATNNALRKVARAKGDLRADLEDVVGSNVVAAGSNVFSQPKESILEGTRVRVQGVREPGRVSRVFSPTEFEVQVGFMKMRVGRAEITEVLTGDGGSSKKLPSGVSFQQGPAWNTVTRELNLIGKRADEAEAELEKFLDVAALSEIDRVRIIHGHGMGILKKAVAEMLRKSPHVAQHYPATPAEGGNGATIAELKV